MNTNKVTHCVLVGRIPEREDMAFGFQLADPIDHAELERLFIREIYAWDGDGTEPGEVAKVYGVPAYITFKMFSDSPIHVVYNQ